MKSQMKSLYCEVSSEKYFSEYALIDSSVIDSTDNNLVDILLDSSVIFG